MARSVITIEGVIEDICPELNLLALMSAKITEKMKKSFDLKKTAIDFGKGLTDIEPKAAGNVQLQSWCASRTEVKP